MDNLDPRAYHRKLLLPALVYFAVLILFECLNGAFIGDPFGGIMRCLIFCGFYELAAYLSCRFLVINRHKPLSHVWINYGCWIAFSLFSCLAILAGK